MCSRLEEPLKMLLYDQTNSILHFRNRAIEDIAGSITTCRYLVISKALVVTLRRIAL